MKRNPNELIFSLEHQFTLYLQRAGVTRAILPVDQLTEMRKAFYAGLGQMFFLMSQDVPDLDEGDNDEEAFKMLDSFKKQLTDFWKEEVEKYQAGVMEIHPQSRARCSKCGWRGIVRQLKIPTPGTGLCKCPKCDSAAIEFKTTASNGK